MPLWAVITISVAGSAVLVAAAVFGGFAGFREYRRRRLLKLVIRAEALDVAAQALIDTITRLAESNDAELELFSTEPDSSERRVLAEVATRAAVMTFELDTMPLPRSLIAAAEALADAAYTLKVEAGRVGDDDLHNRALEHLAAVELAPVQRRLEYGRHLITERASLLGLDDTSVYGGGLYP